MVLESWTKRQCWGTDHSRTRAATETRSAILDRTLDANCAKTPQKHSGIVAACKIKGTTHAERQPSSWHYLLVYGLDPPKTKWEILQKILWDSSIQIDNQLDIDAVDKNQKSALVVDIPRDRNVRRREFDKLKKYQGLKELKTKELKTCKVKNV